PALRRPPHPVFAGAPAGPPRRTLHAASGPSACAPRKAAAPISPIPPCDRRAEHSAANGSSLHPVHGRPADHLAARVARVSSAPRLGLGSTSTPTAQPRRQTCARNPSSRDRLRGSARSKRAAASPGCVRGIPPALHGPRPPLRRPIPPALLPASPH